MRFPRMTSTNPRMTSNNSSCRTLVTSFNFIIYLVGPDFGKVNLVHIYIITTHVTVAPHHQFENKSADSSAKSNPAS